MKTNLLKNMTAAIAALLIALVALPQVAKAEEFWLLGTKYNADTEVEIGGGKATWNKASRTLTLNNVNLESHDGRFIYCEEISSFKIELVGTNKINCTGEGLYFKKGDVKIYGSGSLTINSASNFAIYQTDTTPCTLTIKDCTIDARGEKSSIGGYYNGSNTETLTLALENATLTVKGATGGWGWKESGITAIKSWDLNNCHIATEGVKLGKSGSNTYYCLIKDGDVYIGEAKIIPGMPQAKEAYVVENGSTLTFYYDKQKNSRTGTVYDIDQKKQAGSVPVPVWAGTETNKKESILKAVFDSSFKDYKPTESRFWFAYFTKMNTIEGIENLNTEQVTSMGYMFYGCESLSSLDLSNFNTAKVKSLEQMFCGCKSLTTLNISGFTTDEVIYMSGMFKDCSALTSVDLTNFNTANVTIMFSMFSGCYALTTLDLTNFNTAKVTDMRYMFMDCPYLTTIYCNDTWTCSKSSGMFIGCTKLKGAVAYNASKTDASMANPETGYFTKELHQTYDVVLESYNDQKIECIKVVRELTGVSISEGKIIVESAPCIVVENLSKEEAEAARDKFNAAGGTANIYPHGTWVPAGINPVGVDVPLKQQGIYNLRGMKIQGSPDNLPAGIYIVGGKKVVKK